MRGLESIFPSTPRGPQHSTRAFLCFEKSTLLYDRVLFVLYVALDKSEFRESVREAMMVQRLTTQMSRSTPRSSRSAYIF
jgi:hypothetical protein